VVLLTKSFFQGVLNCVRGIIQVSQVEVSLTKACAALGGYTHAQSAETAFDIDDFDEVLFVAVLILIS
jgi:hypothetical protein